MMSRKRSFENTGLLHVMISNVKAFIRGTFHGLPKKSLDLYLSEFCFRFNRRNMNLFERVGVAVDCSFLTKRDNQKWKYRFHLLCMYLGRQFRLHRFSLRISLSWDHWWNCSSGRFASRIFSENKQPSPQNLWCVILRAGFYFFGALTLAIFNNAAENTLTFEKK